MTSLSQGRPRAYVVGIAGGSASGKSTLAAALQQALENSAPPLRVAVLRSDAYFRHRDPQGPQVMLPGGERHFDYNRPDSVDAARLAADMDALAGGAAAPDVVLLEGLLVLHEASIRQRLDLRLFVELDADVRALRRLVRNLGPNDTVDLANGQWIAAYYCASARVGHTRYVEPSRAHADLIVRGDADCARTAALLASVVRDGLAAPERTKTPSVEAQR